MSFYVLFYCFIFSGISSLVFTKNAEALYLHSSSELQRISLSATHATKSRCYLALPPGAREEEEDEENEGENKFEQDVPLVNGLTTDSKEGSVGDKVSYFCF